MSNDFAKRGGCTEVDLAACNDSDFVVIALHDEGHIRPPVGRRMFAVEIHDAPPRVRSPPRVNQTSLPSSNWVTPQSRATAATMRNP